MNAVIYLEGGSTGPDSKLAQQECQRGFRLLLENCGFSGRMPRLFASGSRNLAFRDFQNAYNKQNNYDYVAMLIDSEDPVIDINRPWEHLKFRDGWNQPVGSIPDQVLFMTTCMETWIYANHQSMPVTPALEKIDRHEILDKLEKSLPNGYKKGKQSFRLLAKVDPVKLEPLLHFQRVKSILDSRLRGKDTPETR